MLVLDEKQGTKSMIKLLLYEAEKTNKTQVNLKKQIIKMRAQINEVDIKQCRKSTKLRVSF